MSIQYIPGWGDTIGDNVGKIGEGIADIINPHRKLQQEFDRANLLSGGELMQKLANKRATGVDLSKAHLSKDQQTALDSTSADPGYLNDLAMEKAKAKILTPENAADIASRQYGEDEASRLRRQYDQLDTTARLAFMKAHPDLMEHKLFKEATGFTSQKAADYNDMQVDVGIADIPNQQRKIEEQKKVPKFDPTTMNLGDIAKRVVRGGKVDENTLAAIEGNESAKGVFNTLRQGEHDRYEAELRRSIANIGHSPKDLERLADEQMIQRAGSIASKLNVSPNSIYYIHTGKALPGQKEPTPQELRDAQGRISTMSTQDQLENAAKLRTGTSSLIRDLKSSKTDDTGRALLADKLAENLRAGGLDVYVKDSKHQDTFLGFNYGKKSIQFQDSNGNIYEASDFDQVPPGVMPKPVSKIDIPDFSQDAKDLRSMFETKGDLDAVMNDPAFKALSPAEKAYVTRNRGTAPARK